MLSPFHAFMTGLIDYAGLFPPARLSLEQAIRQYAHCKATPDQWMLGRFICPAPRRVELASFHDELFRTTPPFRFSVLGRGGSTRDEFFAGLRNDLDAINDFRRRHGAFVETDLFEVKSPFPAPGDLQVPTREFFWDVFDAIDRFGPPSLTPYFELSMGANFRHAVFTAVDELAEANQGLSAKKQSRCRPGGFKLRCGGLEATAFPSPEIVAFTIAACRNREVPLKATAGMHHPLRRFDPGVQTKMHGFLNVFGAGILARTHKLNEETIRSIVEDEGRASFRFDTRAFTWKNLTATAEQIAAARSQGVISYGCCSFDDPRDGLRALGMLRADS